jgi:hypothetical protein
MKFQRHPQFKAWVRLSFQFPVYKEPGDYTKAENYFWSLYRMADGGKSRYKSWGLTYVDTDEQMTRLFVSPGGEHGRPDHFKPPDRK